MIASYAALIEMGVEYADMMIADIYRNDIVAECSISYCAFIYCLAGYFDKSRELIDNTSEISKTEDYHDYYYDIVIELLKYKFNFELENTMLDISKKDEDLIKKFIIKLNYKNSEQNSSQIF